MDECLYFTGDGHIMCQGEYFKKACPEGEVLVMESGNYGRTNSTVCTPHFDTNCQLSTTLSTLNRYDEGCNALKSGSPGLRRTGSQLC